MVLFPPAKINLGLNVVRKRPDGYHDIETVMVPIPLFDVLEAVVDEELPAGTVQYGASGINIPGDREQDLCLKAIRSMREHVALPGLRVHLHKVIPIGAGLGGGSSDGAHMLLLLNKLFLKGDIDRLHPIAAELGSDAPFFLRNTTQFAEGRGERLTPVALDLSGKWVLLVNPGIHVSTAGAYGAMRSSGKTSDLLNDAQRPIDQWQGRIRNDMEDHVLATHSAVAFVKERIMQAGAAYCSMSGSGSTVFGIFTTRPEPIEWPEDHKQWILPL